MVGLLFAYLHLAAWFLKAAGDAEFIGSTFLIWVVMSGMYGTLLPLVHGLRHICMYKEDLLSKLGSFDLDKVACSNEADRTLIREAIERWYGSVEVFQEFVRGPFRQVAFDSVKTPGGMPFGYVFVLATPVINIGLDGGLALMRAGPSMEAVPDPLQERLFRLSKLVDSTTLGPPRPEASRSNIQGFGLLFLNPVGLRPFLLSRRHWVRALRLRPMGERVVIQLYFSIANHDHQLHDLASICCGHGDRQAGLPGHHMAPLVSSAVDPDSLSRCPLRVEVPLAADRPLRALPPFGISTRLLGLWNNIEENSMSHIDLSRRQQLARATAASFAIQMDVFPVRFASFRERERALQPP